MKTDKSILLLTGMFVIVWASINYCADSIIIPNNESWPSYRSLFPASKSQACWSVVNQPEDPPQSDYSNYGVPTYTVTSSGTVSNPSTSTTTTI